MEYRQLDPPNDDHKEDLNIDEGKSREDLPYLSSNDIRRMKDDFKERTKDYPQSTEIYIHLLDSITKMLRYNENKTR